MQQQFRGGFEVKPPPRMLAGSLSALSDRRAQQVLSTPYQPYYDDVLLPRLATGGYDLIGINITYAWQTPFALWLIRLIRAALPEVFLIAGGTEVSDLVKTAADPGHVFRLFADLDAIVVGEGESAYTELLTAVGAGDLRVAHPNIRLHPRHGRLRALPVLHYEQLRDIPTPDFSGLPWDLYLSPERFVYYSPSRGCYWNKCTFCDYGLNTDGPTSPWRQDTVDTMIRDVTELSRWARFIYFSVDVLAPATIMRFAERVVAADLDFRWGAEIRLEKYWSPQKCRLLRRSGCVAISVGFESGNQRVLDLIDKGTRPAQVKQTIEDMNEAGVAVQIMGFTGFPTETRAEAQDSIDFLVDNRDLWTFGGLGEFVLTSGAIVAKQPDRFGIKAVRPPTDSDFVRALAFAEPTSQGARDDVATAKTQIETTRFDRPWVGGVDTPHSFFYHDRYGVELHRRLERLRGLPSCSSACYVVNGSLIDPPEPSTLDAYLTLYGRPGRTVPPGRLAFRRSGGNILLLPPTIRPYLGAFAEPTTLAEATDRVGLSRPAADRIWAIMLRQGSLRQYRPARVPVLAGSTVDYR